jgi:RimJ/RimL family protein N-acetyltransferase
VGRACCPTPEFGGRRRRTPDRLDYVGNLGAATDGVVALRPPHPRDRAVLVAGRDDVIHRFLGEGSPDPQPTACITVDDETVGWVDFDIDRAWLEPGEINLGYNVFAPHRGRGYATRAVKLLLHRLALDTQHTTATLLIDPDNGASLALAARSGFERGPDLDGNPYWKRPIPPLAYTDGGVTLRRPRAGDLEMDLSAKDDQQIRWLWLPGQREAWEAMTPDQQWTHASLGLQERISTFGTSPKWTFSVDTDTTAYVAYVDCDLVNDHVPAGEANISYSTHPDHRGNGHAQRAVRLVLRFLRDHTGAREAHIITDTENRPSRGVAEAVGATVTETWSNEHGRVMVRHVIAI